MNGSVVAGKPKIVADTNVFINATFARESFSAAIIGMIYAGELELLVTPQIESEYQQQFSPAYIQQRWQGVAKDVAAHIETVRQYATRIEAAVTITDSADPADNKFLECAVSGEADYMISSDDDLLCLRYVQDIPIMTPTQAYRYITAPKS